MPTFRGQKWQNMAVTRVSHSCLLIELGAICNSMAASLWLKSCEDHSLLKSYNGGLWKNNYRSGPLIRQSGPVMIRRGPKPPVIGISPCKSCPNYGYRPRKQGWFTEAHKPCAVLKSSVRIVGRGMGGLIFLKPLTYFRESCKDLSREAIGYIFVSVLYSRNFAWCEFSWK